VQVTDLMVPLLKFYFHEEVRRAAVAALPHLLRSAQAAAEKGVPGASKVSRVQGYKGLGFRGTVLTAAGGRGNDVLGSSRISCCCAANLAVWFAAAELCAFSFQLACSCMPCKIWVLVDTVV
jgi:hypothetical protein